MNENDAMDTSNDSFEDDELMRKLSKPPEFPAASPDQVEQTWAAIVAHVEAEQAAPAVVPAKGRGLELPEWLQQLFPAAPVWSWQFARVAALILMGFGVAWIAAGQGWLPGVGTAPVGTDEVVVADDAPNRAWLAANDYGSRLEALLLGLAAGDDSAGPSGTAAREASRELLNDSRFYRRVAQSNDDAALSELLSRIEVVLLALATAPEGQEEDVMNTLREFIAESDVLGELRDVQSTVPKRPQFRSAAATTGS